MYPKYYDSISPGYDELYKQEQLKKIRVIKNLIINIINIDNKNKIINNKNNDNNKIKNNNDTIINNINDKNKIINNNKINNNKNENNKKQINKNNNNNKINDYKILDVGCGPGFSEVISINIIGIDPSIELLKKAKIKRVNGIAESLPFKDKVFDIVISVTAIHNFNNIKKAVKEMKRVAKDKNNYFIVSVLKKSPKFNIIKNILNKNFKIKSITEEEKDVIFFCKAKV